MFFENRTHAGRCLAETMRGSGKDFGGCEVVGIARGGVIVAAEVAAAFDLPLRALAVDDLAIADGVLSLSGFGDGFFFPNPSQQPRRELRIRSGDLGAEPVVRNFRTRLASRQRKFNSGQPLQVGVRVIVCDDGLVSGRSVRVAVAALKAQGASEITLAIPVVPPWIMSHPDRGFEVVTWRVTTMDRPTTGIFYFKFEEVSDRRVVRRVTRHASGALVP